MAMAFTFRVLDNSARNYVLQVNGSDASSTTAATTDGNTTGIIAANGYTPTVSLKVRRILYNTTNCTANLQWHATSNTNLIFLSGYGDYNLKLIGSIDQGIINDKATGATGDIDLFSYAINTVTGGAGLLTASMSLVLFCIKGA